MIIRTKSGEYRAGTASVLCKQSLLDFLGLKKDTAGLVKVAGDVEVIASIPIFSFSNGQRAVSNEQLTMSKEKSEEGVPWVLSTFDLDRYAERIDPLGWDFKRFMDNPVVEWAHRYDIPAIGKIEGLAIDDNGLHGLVFFNNKSFDHFGWSIGERVKAGVIRAGSVGFRPIEIEIPSKEDSRDGTSLIFRKQELLEFSICNVPANPFALANEELGRRKEEVGIANNSNPFWGGLIQMNNEQ